MKKTINVNIGGYPFIIDIDAYDKLEDYLTIIESHFSKSEGCDEIVHDIELRFAELLQERPTSGQIVANSDIESAIKILGTPEDFGAETEEQYYDDRYSTNPTNTNKSSKRLFRDKEEKILLGLCSGMAQYFGMNDPFWIRLIFVVMAFCGGAGLPIYLILSMITRYAKTPMDRLAMRGEKINVDNIAKTVENSIVEITEKIDEIHGKISKKKRF